MSYKSIAIMAATLLAFGLATGEASARGGMRGLGYSPSQVFNGNDGYQTSMNPYKPGGGIAYNTHCSYAYGKCKRQRPR